MLFKFIGPAPILLVFAFISCSHHEATPAIPLGIVRQSSDLLSSDIIFGTSSKKIQEENEILVQTGEIDTTTEQAPVGAAIIYVNRVEIVLHLSKRYILENKIVEEYSYNDYSLILSYSESISGIYNATCTITNKKLKSVYNLVGTKYHSL